jgi:hypothetical protein
MAHLAGAPDARKHRRAGDLRPALQQWRRSTAITIVPAIAGYHCRLPIRARAWIGLAAVERLADDRIDHCREP